MATLRADPSDGWWFGAVLDGFAFLDRDFGWRLKEVHQHFRGNFVRFEGPAFDLVIEHDPEDSGHIGAELWVSADLASGATHPRAIAVNDLIKSRDPKASLPNLKRGGYSQGEVLAALSTWATALRAVAPDVLRGAWPEGVAAREMW